MIFSKDITGRVTDARILTMVAWIFAGTLIGIAVSQIQPQTAGAQYVATTSVSLTVCGDGLVTGFEVCDDTTNTGAWAPSIATRNCNPLCSGYGPHCGDGIIQTLQGEECDDSNNTDGDLCDLACQNETPPVVVGGGGGGSSGGGGSGSGNNLIDDASRDGEIPFEGDTDVIIKGRAYPGATITILRDGEVEGVVEADNNAAFDKTFADQTPGITTFGFWALDNAGRTSITYSATFHVVENAVTTLSGILVPPTIAVVPEKAPPGSTVTFEGSAAPSAEVSAFVDNGETPEVTLASGGGEWAIVHDTTPLSVEAFHTVKANYVDTINPDLKSGFSKIVSFYVGNNDVDASGSGPDLNTDEFVNLTDFSILLFNWNTTSTLADINQDGIVSLPDFSIMLFYWTG